MRGILTVVATTALLGTVAAPAGAASPEHLGTPALGGSGWSTPGPGAGATPPATDEPAVAMDQHGHLPAATVDTVPVELGSPTADFPADWSLIGPAGGDAFDVAVSTVDPNLVLAGLAPNGGSGGALYRSTDGGDTWSKVPELANVSVFDIEFRPDGRVYVGTVDGVWVGDATAENWTALNLNIGPNDTVYDVAVDPSNPDTLWAGVAEALGHQPVNLLRSTDGGATWQDRTPPMGSPLGGRAIAVHPNDSDTVVAGFGGSLGGGAVWVTTDGGATWQNRTSGLPGMPINTVTFVGDRLLVGGGLRFGSQFLGLYASDQLGAAWTPLHDATWPLLVVEDVAVAPGDPDTLLVATDGTGVHRSTDGGQTWEIGIGGSDALAGRAVRFAPGDPDTVFLGVSSLAVWRSTDGGDAFTASSEGIAELNLTSVAANPLNPDELAVSFRGQNDGGVLSSTDAGQSWRVESTPPTRYGAVAFAPDGTLYALSTGPSSVAPEGLYQRQPDGTWKALGPDQGTLFESELFSIAFSTVDPELIMLGGNDFGVAGSEATIWRTDDGGESWTKVYEDRPGDSVTDLEIVADGTDQTMVATVSSLAVAGGVLRSTDAGISWGDSSVGLPNDYFRDQRLCASPANPETLFLSGWTSLSVGGVFRSDDAGASWTSTGWSGARIYDLACDPVDDQVLYVAQAGAERVARSEDQGQTFAPFTAGLEEAATPTGFAFAGDSYLLLATSSGSYRTQLRDVPEPPGPDPEPVVCDTTITGVHVGALHVTEGVTCLAAGAQVLGEVNVSAGAGLVATA
ncbi:MAG TPA: hypothetical protein VKZ67_04435, partial [Natronosporangium sp.]|nr:hypothetical protein [Natronosporangium sp.]